MVATGQAEKGSEKPTLEEAAGSGSLAETGLKDFRSHKVFLIESEKVFWASGTTLSTEGRDFLSNLGLLVSRVPGRIAVSEVGPGDNPDIGILRAIAVVEYLGSHFHRYFLSFGMLAELACRRKKYRFANNAP